ncbi:MAG: tetratricopeptide repeat protein [Bacteroidota bacterium]
MIRVILIAILATGSLFSYSQPISYENSQGEVHLAGSITPSDLNSGHYNEWYEESYSKFELSDKSTNWSSSLEDAQVKIFLGTWCGDSKKWVPRFVHLWEELGLDPNQLEFTALHDGVDKYKQGPEAEEKGYQVHRVPTFIFSREGEEFARIVESPVSDLETDLAQIALGYPSEPNYRAATYMMELLANNTDDEIDAQLKEHLNTVYRMAHQSKELNTLGYVYLRSGRIREAVTTFMFNTYYFPYEPNVYDSYAEALEADGQLDQALENYEKALALDPGNERTKEKVMALQGDQ